MLVYYPVLSSNGEHLKNLNADVTKYGACLLTGACLLAGACLLSGACLLTGAVY